VVFSVESMIRSQPIEHLVGKPLEKTQPNLDRWWLIYVALVAGGLLSWD